jgi:hypothetical protein
LNPFIDLPIDFATARTAVRSDEPSSPGGVPTAMKRTSEDLTAASRSVVNVDRDPSGLERVDLRDVLVDADDVVAGLGEARPRDESHVAGTDDGDLHERLLLRPNRNRAGRAMLGRAADGERS